MTCATAAKKLTLTGSDGKTNQYGFSFDPWDMEPGWSEAIWSYGGDILNADHTKTLIGGSESPPGLADALRHDLCR